MLMTARHSNYFFCSAFNMQLKLQEKNFQKLKCGEWSRGFSHFMRQTLSFPGREKGKHHHAGFQGALSIGPRMICDENKKSSL